MKRLGMLLGGIALIGVAAAETAPAQTRVRVSVGVVTPHVYGHVVVGDPYYRVVPPPRVVVVHRPRHYRDRYHWPHRYYHGPAVVVVDRRHVHRPDRRHRVHRYHY